MLGVHEGVFPVEIDFPCFAESSVSFFKVSMGGNFVGLAYAIDSGEDLIEVCGMFIRFLLGGSAGAYQYQYEQKNLPVCRKIGLKQGTVIHIFPGYGRYAKLI
jgi:hypothetical protein